MVTDGLINAICIVFSFNMRYVTMPNFKCDRISKTERAISTNDVDAGKIEC